MIAAIFPGQGSQRPGMGLDLVQDSTEAAAVFDRVRETVGIDVVALCRDSDDEALRQTQNAQLALFTCGLAAYRALVARLSERPETPKIEAVAGHSVGEYAAAVAAGIFGIEDGAHLVRVRGELMAEAGRTTPGTMAAVLGLDVATIESACRDAGGVVVLANDNCPGQIVISGEVEAVKRASEIAKGRGAKRVLPLNVSGAFHSPLMDDAGDQMGEALHRVSVHAPQLAIYSNVTAERVDDESEVPPLLESQLSNPVRWTEIVRNMVRDGVDTFVECGSGEVLCGLIRRIEPGVRCFAVQDAASLASAVEKLIRVE